jgi:hypothetical protein
MSQEERKYVGRGKKAGNFDLVNFSISESKVKENWFEYNGERYLKLTIGALKNPDNYGKTHSVWIDNYKPKEGGNDGGGQAPAKEKLNDLPF